MKVQLDLNTMFKKSGHCGKVGVRGVGLKSLDLVWTVLRKAEIELQIEHTLRFFGGLFFGLKSLDLVWTVLRKAEIELQFEHTVRFFFHLFKNFHRFLVTVVFGSSPTGAQSLFR